MGRIVDGYTNISTLKLFAHTRQEDAYVAEAVRDSRIESELEMDWILGRHGRVAQ